MTSTNDHLPPPPKPRMSPLEFRNTDLVSRLLAATPPYLYNMSLLPNTYFFSEMLRSFVQAKAQRTASFHPPVRRSRKRNWTASRTECFEKPPTEQKPEETPQEVDWMLKSNKKIEENPLELTMHKMDNDTFQNRPENYNPKIEHTAEVFSNIHHNLTSQDNNPQNLVLPPPPPIWYPPLYPAPPYGIDPLHFFIDLRVSGHIYDRKNQKDHTEVSPSDSSSKDKLPHTEVSNFKFDTEVQSGSFKQTRNCSAFSVPIPSSSKPPNPINLSEKETKSTKFDVKSMGFDKPTNRMSTNYIMSNISKIYKYIHLSKDIPVENSDEKENADNEKKVKDLRAVIGLELVVDYMKHKPGKSSHDESSISTDIESAGSPTLEVVDDN